MSAITVYTEWPVSDFVSGVEGVGPILSTGTTIDSSQLSAVQAAGLASGVMVIEGTPPSQGGQGPAIAEQVDLGVALGAAELDDTGHVPTDELGNVAALSSAGAVIGSIGAPIDENTAFGADNSAYAGSGTMWSLTTGTANTALGTAALFGTTSGVQNTGLGAGALRQNATGGGNVGVGADAGGKPGPTQDGAWATVVGGANTFVGAFSGAGNASDPSFAVAVGANALVGSSGATALGYSAVASGSDSIALGGASAAPGNYALAGGTLASAAGASSVALGFEAASSGLGSIAIGTSSVASAAGSVAIGTDDTGAGASSSTVNQITLGTANHMVSIPGALKVAGNPVGTQRAWIAVGGGIGFKNSWANDSGYTPASYRLSPDGTHVEMAGTCVGGTAGSIAFTLPAGYIPTTKKYLNAGYATIDTSGNVVFPASLGSLDGILFPLDI
jgi:hypothetical protein